MWVTWTSQVRGSYLPHSGNLYNVKCLKTAYLGMYVTLVFLGISSRSAATIWSGSRAGRARARLCRWLSSDTGHGTTRALNSRSILGKQAVMPQPGEQRSARRPPAVPGLQPAGPWPKDRDRGLDGTGIGAWMGSDRDRKRDRDRNRDRGLDRDRRPPNCGLAPPPAGHAGQRRRERPPAPGARQELLGFERNWVNLKPAEFPEKIQLLCFLH